MYIRTAVISGTVILFTMIANIAIKRALRIRKDKIDHLKNSAPIMTSASGEQSLKTFRNQAKRKMTARFSIYRRVLFSALIVFFILAVAFPFIDKLPQAYLSILVGSAAIITGMAAKPFIENFLAGIAITASKMVNIGDTILINDHYGTIEDISSTHTVIKLWNWKRYVIPNSTMISTEFQNFSLYDKWIWTHADFTVSYDEDMDQVEEIALQAVLDSPFYNKETEAPSFWIMKTEKTAVSCWIAAWAGSPGEAWELGADMRKRIIKGFRKAGIKTHINYVAGAGIPAFLSGE